MHFLILIKYLLFCLNYISISTYILNKTSLKNENEFLLFINFNIFLDKVLIRILIVSESMTGIDYSQGIS